MNEYEEYVIKCWKESEAIGTKIGVTDNYVIAKIFIKICQPKYFYDKNKKEK